MKNYRFRALIPGIVLFSVAGLLAAQEAEHKAKPHVRKPVLLTPSEMKWVDVPDAKGSQQAVVWGNAQKGAHASFARFASGTELPLHTHTASSRSVVIAGTMVETMEGEKPKELGPGSYFFWPAEVKHTTGCKAGQECIIYTDWSGAFDLKPATP